jgi:hypothetical protein
MPTAAHFIYIPGVLILGIVIGWILGTRAAADAYAAQARRRGPAAPERPVPKSPAGEPSPHDPPGPEA